MSHDISDYEVLGLPTAHADFMPAWRKYCRTEVKKEFDATHVAEFWESVGSLWKPCWGFGRQCVFLINVPATSADVQRSFSLMGCMDTKLWHALPNESRKLATMLMFNGDLEGRFD